MSGSDVSWTVLGVAACGVAALGLLWLAVSSRAAAGEDDPEEAGTDARRRPGGALAGLRALGSLLRPDEEQALAELKSRATRAGLYTQDAVDLFLTVRLVVVAAGGGLFLLILTSVDNLLTALSLLLMITAVSAIAPNYWLEQRARRRQRAIAQSLPEVLDLLALCLEAGLGLEQAIERVVSSGNEDDLLADELEMVLSDIRLGVSVERAFQRFAARIGSDQASAVASLVGKASTLGGKIGEVLRAHASSMREQRLLAFEEAAGRANAKLALPLAVFLLPAGLALLLAPPFMTLFEML